MEGRENALSSVYVGRMLRKNDSSSRILRNTVRTRPMDFHIPRNGSQHFVFCHIPHTSKILNKGKPYSITGITREGHILMTALYHMLLATEDRTSRSEGTARYYCTHKGN